MITDLLGLPFPLGIDLINLLPFWAAHLVLGLLLVGLISAGGFVLSRLGHSPLWALLLIVPGFQVLAYWVMAFKPWPRERTENQP